MILSIAMAMALFGGGEPRKFVEQVQEVQVEADHSPSVGRRAERRPEAFVPVRYLTPEQRAEPIIVDPAPVIIASSEGQQTNGLSGFGSGADAPSFDQNGVPQQASTGAVPSYITSAPDAFQSSGGSATGSTAVPDYGIPGS